MNAKFKNKLLQKLKLLSSFEHQDKGYTMTEVIVITIMVGIIGVAASPLFTVNDPLNDGINQSKEILQQARNRAISTTTAVRVQPDPNSPNQKLVVQRAENLGCGFFTRLSAPIPLPLVPNNILVNSPDGFVIGNQIRIGNQTGFTINSTPGGTNTLTLDRDITTPASANTIVTLDNNWAQDGLFTSDNLTLPKKGDQQTTITASVSDWSICFNSRGIATIYDDDFNEYNDLLLTVTSGSNSKQIKILKGGAIQDVE